MKDKFRTSVLPVFAAFIWGTAFVAQKVNTMGAFGFNACRSLVAVLFLLCMIPIFTRGDFRHILSEHTKEGTRALWVGGILAGLSMGAATFFQQKGMDLGTEASKAGFITALYVVLVPVFGLFFGKRVKWTLWIGVLLAAAGLYLICLKGQGMSFFSGVKDENAEAFRSSDLVVLFAAALFTCQILLIGHFSEKCHPVKMSCVEFIAAFVFSTVLSVIFEKNTLALVKENLIPILYLGIMSSGVAYTLQVVSQRGANPAVISILMSLESVFSVLSSAVVLHERLTPREYIGCAVMFIAVILSQLSTFEFRKKGDSDSGSSGTSASRKAPKSEL